jgi:hypothetical protein
MENLLTDGCTWCRIENRCPILFEWKSYLTSYMKLFRVHTSLRTILCTIWLVLDLIFQRFFV